MSAWGSGSFENDDAMDWLDVLTDSGDDEPIIGALEEVVAMAEAGDYIEASFACNALAAAEIVAALHGKPSADLPKEATAWLAGKAAPPTSLLATAIKAVRAIRAGENSELKALWQESGEMSAWSKVVEDLENRLA